MIRFHMDKLIVPGKTVELKERSSVFAAADKKPFLLSFGRLSALTFPPAKQNQTKAMYGKGRYIDIIGIHIFLIFLKKSNNNPFRCINFVDTYFSSFYG